MCLRHGCVFLILISVFGVRILHVCAIYTCVMYGDVRVRSVSCVGRHSCVMIRDVWVVSVPACVMYAKRVSVARLSTAVARIALALLGVG